MAALLEPFVRTGWPAEKAQALLEIACDPLLRSPMHSVHRTIPHHQSIVVASPPAVSPAAGWARMVTFPVHTNQVLNHVGITVFY